MTQFRKDLEVAINRAYKESGSDTPAFILAEYLENCLKAFDQAVYQRKTWYANSERRPEEKQPEGYEPACGVCLARTESKCTCLTPVKDN